VVDEYVLVVGEIEEDIDEMETRVFDPQEHVDSEQIYRLKREVAPPAEGRCPVGRPVEVPFRDTDVLDTR